VVRYRTINGVARSHSPCDFASPRLRGAQLLHTNVYVDWFGTGVLDQQENYRVIVDFASATAQYRLSAGRLFADYFEL
jgi:hypothetical protein